MRGMGAVGVIVREEVPKSETRSGVPGYEVQTWVSRLVVRQGVVGLISEREHRSPESDEGRLGLRSDGGRWGTRSKRGYGIIGDT